jgi:uridine kinase
MTEFLAEQMRSLARRLEELNVTPQSQDDLHTDEMPQEELEGNINPKQLADILGLRDTSLFQRAIRKIRDGHSISRPEMTEVAIAFERLLAAEPEDTQKAMVILKRIHRHHPQD